MAPASVLRRTLSDVMLWVGPVAILFGVATNMSALILGGGFLLILGPIGARIVANTSYSLEARAAQRVRRLQSGVRSNADLGWLALGLIIVGVEVVGVVRWRNELRLFRVMPSQLWASYQEERSIRIVVAGIVILLMMLIAVFLAVALVLTPVVGVWRRTIWGFRESAISELEQEKTIDPESARRNAKNGLILVVFCFVLMLAIIAATVYRLHNRFR
jgi:hypothetical protein